MSNKIEEKCLAKGVKLTDQRKIIAKVMSESNDHPDVDELYKRVSVIDTKISIDKLISLNQTCTITLVIIANIMPFKIPIINSFETIFAKLLEVNSFVAMALTVTAKVCIPALPPIDATIGIKNAKATICSIVAPNLLITQVDSKAVNKFNNNQLNLLLVF